MLDVWLEPGMINEQFIKDSFYHISSDNFYFPLYIKVPKTGIRVITNVYIPWGSCVFLHFPELLLNHQCAS